VAFGTVFQVIFCVPELIVPVGEKSEVPATATEQASVGVGVEVGGT